MPPAEIIKEVRTNGEALTEILRFNADHLEPDCLNEALTAAVGNDNHYNVGKLIIKGADKINKALQQSADEKKPHARAMLLLVHAAMNGNCNLVLRLFGEPTSGPETCREVLDDTFPDVQKAVLSGKVSTVVPIEIARRFGHAPVREELLLNTDVNEQEKSVHWHGLQLLVLDINWLRKIHWVQKLRLDRNGFKTLPNEMGTYLKQVHVHVCMGMCIANVLLYYIHCAYCLAFYLRCFLICSRRFRKLLVFHVYNFSFTT